MKLLIMAALGLCFVGANGAQAQQEPLKTDAVTCAGVYATMDNMRNRMGEVWPVFKKSNIYDIDYKGRSEKLIAVGGDDVKYGYLVYAIQSKGMVLEAIEKNDGAKIGDVLKAAARCDFANNMMPTFEPPK